MDEYSSPVPEPESVTPPRIVAYPPVELQDHPGKGWFREVGDHMLDLLVRLGQLKPTDTLIDIGCGPGRIAIPLAQYLSAGIYRGFDVHSPSISWCRNNITPLRPNFHFDHLDVANSRYNPEGSISPPTARFPYPDCSFDFACAISIFTHLLPDSYRTYLSEIRRVLKPGGTLFATYFLLNPDASALMFSHPGNPQFIFELPGCLVADPGNPEGSLAYREADVISAHGRANLEIDTIFAGAWCGRDDAVSYQDIVIAHAG
jgi:SAM-dependent methyltransferase